MSLRFKIIGIGAVLGAAAGYAYYYYIGCSTGSCNITSDPINSSVYGLIMGGLALDLVHDLTVKKRKSGKENNDSQDQP